MREEELIDRHWLGVGNKVVLGCIRLRAVAVVIRVHAQLNRAMNYGPLLLDVALAPHINP